jgi:hypothetical protein
VALPIKLVFIDTQVYIAETFNYNSRRFSRLRELIEQGRIRMLTTSVTVEEVKAHIRVAVVEAARALKSATKDAKILRNVPNSGHFPVFSPFDVEAHNLELVRQFEDFLAQTHTELVDISEVRVVPLLEKYFQRHPPFSDKKKAEFPDAIVLAALEEKGRVEGTLISIISGDGDMVQAATDAPQLEAFERLEKLIEIVTTDEAHVLSYVREHIEALRPKIDGRIRDEIEARGTWLTDQDGDAELESVDNIVIEDEYVVDVDKDTVWIDLITQVTISVAVNYPDMSTATYDSEDKVAYAWRDIETTLERELEVRISLMLDISAPKGSDESLIEFSVDLPRDIGITVEEWDYH